MRRNLRQYSHTDNALSRTDDETSWSLLPANKLSPAQTEIFSWRGFLPRGQLSPVRRKSSGLLRLLPADKVHFLSVRVPHSRAASCLCVLSQLSEHIQAVWKVLSALSKPSAPSLVLTWLRNSRIPVWSRLRSRRVALQTPTFWRNPSLIRWPILFRSFRIPLVFMDPITWSGIGSWRRHCELASSSNIGLKNPYRWHILTTLRGKLKNNWSSDSLSLTLSLRNFMITSLTRKLSKDFGTKPAHSVAGKAIIGNGLVSSVGPMHYVRGHLRS